MSSLFSIGKIYAILLIFSWKIKDFLCSEQQVDGQISLKALCTDPFGDGQCTQRMECDLNRCSFDFGGSCLQCSCLYPSKDAACAAAKCKTNQFCKILDLDQCRNGLCKAICQAVDSGTCYQYNPCKSNEKCRSDSTGIHCDYIGPPHNCEELNKYEPCKPGQTCVERRGVAYCETTIPRNCQEYLQVHGPCPKGYICEEHHGSPSCQRPLPPSSCFELEKQEGKCASDRECKVYSGVAICVPVVDNDPCNLIDCREQLCRKRLNGKAFCINPCKTSENTCIPRITCRVDHLANGIKCIESENPCAMKICAPDQSCIVDSEGIPKCLWTKNVCHKVFCGPSKHCVWRNGKAYCEESDLCKMVRCPEDSDCEIVNKVAHCSPSYHADVDACRKVSCERNQFCLVKKPIGFCLPIGSGENLCDSVICSFGAICVEFSGGARCLSSSVPDICEVVDCGSNAECENQNGIAVCMALVFKCRNFECGHNKACVIRNRQPVCIDIEQPTYPCDGVRCPSSMECVIFGGNTICVTKDAPDACTGISCKKGYACMIVNGYGVCMEEIPWSPCDCHPCPAGMICENLAGYAHCSWQSCERSVCEASCERIKCEPSQRCEIRDNVPHCINQVVENPCRMVECPPGYRCTHNSEFAYCEQESTETKCTLSCGPGQVCDFYKGTQYCKVISQPDVCAAVECPHGAVCKQHNGQAICYRQDAIVCQSEREVCTGGYRCTIDQRTSEDETPLMFCKEDFQTSGCPSTSNCKVPYPYCPLLIRRNSYQSCPECMCEKTVEIASDFSRPLAFENLENVAEITIPPGFPQDGNLTVNSDFRDGKTRYSVKYVFPNGTVIEEVSDTKPDFEALKEKLLQ